MTDKNYYKEKKCPYCLEYKLVWLKEIEYPEGQLFRCHNCDRKVFFHD